MGIEENRDSTERSRLLCEILDIERPVVSAPMAAVAGGALAAAVSDSGGLGLIGGGYGDPDWIAEQMDIASPSKVGVGLITWNMAPGTVEAVLQLEPKAVLLSFGDPTRHIESIRDAGVLPLCQIATDDEARIAQSAGVQIVIAQGSESGGHGLGSHPLPVLIDKIRTSCPELHVVAAGGITTRADFDRYRAIGASGVMMGTALYATNEALDTESAKMRLVSATNGDTIRSRVYDLLRGPEWPEGYTGRSLRSELTGRWADHEESLRQGLATATQDYEEAVRMQDLKKRVVWAGEGVGRIVRYQPASEVIRQIPLAST